MKKIRKILRKVLEKIEDLIIKISRGRFGRLTSDYIITFFIIQLLLFFLLVKSDILLLIFFEVSSMALEIFIVKLLISGQSYEEEKEQKMKLRFFMLKERYEKYILIVEEVVNKKFSSIDPNFVSKYNFELRKDDYSYIEKFEENLEWIKEHFVTGELDSFTIASCLMSALIERKQIKFSLEEDMPTDLFSINYMIAFEVALKVISEPFVYEEDKQNCESIKKELEKRKIHISEGVIPSSPLSIRILNGTVINNIYGKNFDIIQFSNLLHLIYIISKVEEKSLYEV